MRAITGNSRNGLGYLDIYELVPETFRRRKILSFIPGTTNKKGASCQRGRQVCYSGYRA